MGSSGEEGREGQDSLCNVKTAGDGAVLTGWGTFLTLSWMPENILAFQHIDSVLG